VRSTTISPEKLISHVTRKTHHFVVDGVLARRLLLADNVVDGLCGAEGATLVEGPEGHVRDKLRLKTARNVRCELPFGPGCRGVARLFFPSRPAPHLRVGVLRVEDKLVAEHVQRATEDDAGVVAGLDAANEDGGLAHLNSNQAAQIE